MVIQTATDFKVKSYSHVLWCYSGVLLLVSVALIAPQSDRPTTISLAEKILLKIGDNNDNHDVDVDKVMKWDQRYPQANNLCWVQQSKNKKNRSAWKQMKI